MCAKLDGKRRRFRAQHTSVMKPASTAGRTGECNFRCAPPKEVPPILAAKFMHSPALFRHSRAQLAALSSSLAGHTSDLNEWRIGFAPMLAGETSVLATAFSCVTGDRTMVPVSPPPIP